MIKSASCNKLLTMASSCGSARKLSTKEKNKRHKDAERVEKLRLLINYLKSGSSQPLVNPVTLEADELELAERYKLSHMALREDLLNQSPPATSSSGLAANGTSQSHTLNVQQKNTRQASSAQNLIGTGGGGGGASGCGGLLSNSHNAVSCNVMSATGREQTGAPVSSMTPLPVAPQHQPPAPPCQPQQSSSCNHFNHLGGEKQAPKSGNTATSCAQSTGSSCSTSSMQQAHSISGGDRSIVSNVDSGSNKNSTNNQEHRHHQRGRRKQVAVWSLRHSISDPGNQFESHNHHPNYHHHSSTPFDNNHHHHHHHHHHYHHHHTHDPFHQLLATNHCHSSPLGGARGGVASAAGDAHLDDHHCISQSVTSSNMGQLRCDDHDDHHHHQEHPFTGSYQQLTTTTTSDIQSDQSVVSSVAAMPAGLDSSSSAAVVGCIQCQHYIQAGGGVCGAGAMPGGASGSFSSSLSGLGATINHMAITRQPTSTVNSLSTTSNTLVNSFNQQPASGPAAAAAAAKLFYIDDTELPNINSNSMMLMSTSSVSPMTFTSSSSGFVGGSSGGTSGMASVGNTSGCGFHPSDAGSCCHLGSASLTSFLGSQPATPVTAVDCTPGCNQRQSSAPMSNPAIGCCSPTAGLLDSNQSNQLHQANHLSSSSTCQSSVNMNGSTSADSGHGSTIGAASGANPVTRTWTNPQNLATWIDNEVNSLVHDLEASKIGNSKHRKSAKAMPTTTTTTPAAGCESKPTSKGSKRRWLFVGGNSRETRRNSSGAHST